MKIRLLWLALFPMLAAAQKKLTVTARITGLKEGSKIWLVTANQLSDTLAKATVQKESFVLKATLKEPMLINIFLGGSDKQVLAFFDNTSVKINGDLKKLDKLSIKGSLTNNDFKNFQRTFDPLFQNLMVVNQRLQNGERTDSLMMAMDQAKDTIQTAITVFLKNNPASPVSAFILAATMPVNDDVFLMEQRYNSLMPSAVNNTYGNYVKSTIDETKATAVGGIAADFTQADTSGKQVSLSSFRGKYVLLDFWASWCGPCRQENPNVVATYQKFNTKNFTVLSVSLDRPGQKEKWLQAIHADNLTWTHVSDLQFWNNEVARQYRVQSIPQNFLIGPDGRIVAKDLRGPALEAKLCEVLGCN